MAFSERRVIYMKKYILKFTKTGKEWKELASGVDFLEDEKVYRIEWRFDSFVDYLHGLWGILRKHHYAIHRID